MFEGGLFIVGFVTALALGAVTVLLFSMGRIGVRQFVFWESMLTGLLIFALAPGAIDFLAGLIGVEARGLFVLAMGLLVVYMVVYSLTVQQRDTDRQVRVLAQELALLRFQQEYYSKGGDGIESRGDNSDPQ